jgi:2-deoxy-D-gluconate 3-dehydrogenase
VVTGASGGLGRAIAIAFAEAGGDVAVAARSKPKLEETAHEIERRGARALVVPTDVTSFAEVEGCLARTVEVLGGLHVIVNNAGIARITPLAEASPEDWRSIIDVNLTGVFHGCRAAAPHLIRQRAGKVINLASVLAAVGLPGYSLYAATKGGIISLTRALAVEWARTTSRSMPLPPGGS